MPTYVYEIIRPDGQPGEQFDVFQKMSDSPLTEHPETGESVKRVITAPFIGGEWSDDSMNRKMKDDKKLDQLGFTKYVKAGNGFYEKRAGKGPDVISRDGPIKPQDLK